MGIISCVYQIQSTCEKNHDPNNKNWCAIKPDIKITIKSSWILNLAGLKCNNWLPLYTCSPSFLLWPSLISKDSSAFVENKQTVFQFICILQGYLLNIPFAVEWWEWKSENKMLYYLFNVFVQGQLKMVSQLRAINYRLLCWAKAK